MTKSITALIIDDHTIEIVRLKQILLPRNVEVIICNNVSDAIDCVKRTSIDVLFCNIKIPDMGGIDMMESLNQLDYRRKVVLVSAMDCTILGDICAMCDGFSFEVSGKLLKPYEEKEVEVMLSKVRLESVKRTWFKPKVEVQERDFLLALGEGRVKNYYQPLVDATTFEIIGYEALARWVHPIYGVLDPSYFLPIVKRRKLSEELFDAVFTNALHDIGVLGSNKKISMNVDHCNLEDSDFAERFIVRCKSKGVSPDHFTIEITERDAYKTSTALYKNLLRLRMNGITVSIDDFGTGTSSLEKFAQLPFNELKIDRSFINGLVDDPKKRSIVRAICGLARSLNISVVAEGIEDEFTLKVLGDYSIDVFQGFHLDKPMPLEAITVLNQ